MREILYATGYNKEKKRIRRDYCPGYYSFLLDDYSAERIFKRFSTYSFAFSLKPVGVEK